MPELNIKQTPSQQRGAKVEAEKLARIALQPINLIDDPEYRNKRRAIIKDQSLPFKSIAEIVNSKVGHAEHLYNALVRHAGLGGIPLRIPLSFYEHGDAEDEVTVYSNIIFDIKDLKNWREGLKPINTRSIIPSVFSTIGETYTTEKTDPNKTVKWATPSRVYAKKEKLTLVRYLRKYFPDQLGTKRDDELRDMAQKVMNVFKPPHLIFCEQPSDYVEMFKCQTHTCMVFGNSGHAGTILKELEKENRYSAEWFHWNPHTLGVYICKDGKAVARGILLRDDPTKPFAHYYVGISGTSGAYTAELQKLIVNAGYKPYKANKNDDSWGGNQITIKTNFTVPPIEHKGKLYMPLPFHDSVRTGYYVSWNSEVDMFEISPNPIKDRGCIRVNDTYAYKGMFPKSAIPSEPKPKKVAKAVAAVADAAAAVVQKIVK